MRKHITPANADASTAPKTAAEIERLLTVIEMLARLQCSRRSLNTWCRKGLIPFVKIGPRSIRFHWPSVEQALLRRQREAA